MAKHPSFTLFPAKAITVALQNNYPFYFFDLFLNFAISVSVLLEEQGVLQRELKVTLPLVYDRD